MQHITKAFQLTVVVRDDIKEALAEAGYPVNDPFDDDASAIGTCHMAWENNKQNFRLVHVVPNKGEIIADCTPEQAVVLLVTLFHIFHTEQDYVNAVNELLDTIPYTR